MNELAFESDVQVKEDGGVTYRLAPGEGLIYVLTDVYGNAKVGFTTNYNKRRAQLQTVSPGPLLTFGVYLAKRSLESRLHEAAREWRLMSREWFEACDGFWAAVTPLLDSEARKLL